MSVRWTFYGIIGAFITLFPFIALYCEQVIENVGEIKTQNKLATCGISCHSICWIAVIYLTSAALRAYPERK